MGLVQVGRGFVNLTNEAEMALGHDTNTVIVEVRISPEKRPDAIRSIIDLPAMTILRVAGDSDIVLIVQRHELDKVLASLSAIDGVLETKSLVSIQTLK